MRLVKEYDLHTRAKRLKSATFPVFVSDTLDLVSKWLQDVAGLVQPRQSVPASERAKAAAAEERWRTEVLEQANLLDDPSVATMLRQLIGWPLIPGEAEEQLRREQNQYLYDIGERDPDKFQPPPRKPSTPNTPQQRDKAIRSFDRIKQQRGLRPDRTPQQNEQVNDPTVPLEVADPKRYGKRGA